MLKPQFIKKALDKFGKDVVQQSRSRLTKSGSNFSKELYNSIGYELDVSSKGTSFSFSFDLCSLKKAPHSFFNLS